MAELAERRTYNEERSGYDVAGPCWSCGSAIEYFVDEDGTPRDIRPSAATLDAAWLEAESVLPPHWRIAVSPFWPTGWEAYAYDIRRPVYTGRSAHSSGACFGDTPAAALRALVKAVGRG